MAELYAYNYAFINRTNNRCVGFQSNTAPMTEEDIAASPYLVLQVEENNPDGYFGKYYINGSWYEDAAGTIPWDPTAQAE